MIAQLSQRDPRGRALSSSSGVRCAGSLARNSGVVVCPHTLVSSKSSPAARTKMRAVRLFTDGGRMLSEFAAMRSSSSGLLAVRLLGRAVLGKRRAGARHERLDRVRDVDLVDMGVAALDPDPV